MTAATTQAVILARGLGTRMRKPSGGSGALTEAQQRAAEQGMKGMMPIGRPFLDYVLSSLADGGITDVTLVIGPEHGAAREYFEVTSPPERVRVHFATQAEPRGTADAVAAAKGVVRDAPFLVLNADNLYSAGAVAALCAIGGDGLAAYEADTLVREGGIEPERVFKFALLDIGSNDVLREIKEKPAADDPLALRAERWVSMNLWSFAPHIFEACARVKPSPRGELELQDAVAIAMRELGATFHVVRRREGVLDLSSRGDVAQVAARLAGVEARP